MGGFSLLLLPKCIVSVFITAPAHQHATWVAVYPALFQDIELVEIFFNFEVVEGIIMLLCTILATIRVHQSV